MNAHTSQTFVAGPWMGPLRWCLGQGGVKACPWHVVGAAAARDAAITGLSPVAAGNA